MQDAVDILLGMQNPNGGFASYELIRGPGWLEWLNPAEVFGRPEVVCQECTCLTALFLGDIMIEHSYPECTTSVITALSIFRKHYPTYRKADIQYVVRRREYALILIHGKGGRSMVQSSTFTLLRSRRGAG